MLLCRNPNRFNSIVGVDIDSEATKIANKITNAWTFDPAIITNITHNANDFVFNDANAVYINCSPEHFSSTDWFQNLPINCLTCVQSVNIIDKNDPWFIKQPTPTYDSFLTKYPISNVLYTGVKRIQYDTWGYDRYMIIGRI